MLLLVSFPRQFIEEIYPLKEEERERVAVVSPFAAIPIDLKTCVETTIRRVDNVLNMADIVTPSRYNTFPNFENICTFVQEISRPPNAPVLMKDQAEVDVKESRPRPGRSYSGVRSISRIS